MGRSETDVIVVGLGAMGSHALWRLAGAGARAIGVERFEPGHDRGASHGESRIIRSAYAEGAAYVPLVRRAWELWHELAAASGEPLVTRTGGLMVGPPGSSFVAGAVSAAEAHGLRYEVLTAAELRRRHPPHRITDDLVALYEHDAGILRPERAVRAAAAAATALGAEVLTGSPAIEIVPDPDEPRVRLDGRELSARHVVVAAGAWLPRLLPLPRLRPVRRVMAWFRTRDAGFSPEEFPVFVRDFGEGRSMYGIGSLDGATVKAALHQWPDPSLNEPVDPDAGPRPPGQADATLIGEVVARALTGLDPEPVRMRECTYTFTPDEHFLVGARPELPGITLLGGFSGHGFKFAPVIGEIAAQLALTGRSDLSIDLFDPRRL